jgi:hypothetical protein
METFFNVMSNILIRGIAEMWNKKEEGGKMVPVGL